MRKRKPTLVDLLERHAWAQPGSRGYVFLRNGERESGSRSFAELDARARVVAAWLTRNGLAGARVLLLLRDSLEFVDALVGCFYAGAIVVPVAVPRQNKSVALLRAIAADVGAAGALTGREERAYLEPALAESLPRLRWLSIEDAAGDPAEWAVLAVVPEDLALVQYTSGSTGMPKGVMITHAHLMHNLSAIRHSMGLTQHSLFVGWLPLFHDMGLIGNLLQPLYLGIPCVLMPAIAFVQKPLRWLRAVSTYRATVSGGPNFAYDLCVDKTTPEQRTELDLRSWKVAFNGSEPVRADTIERFAAAFAPAGFRRASFFPCYGMAESTLFVTGAAQGGEPPILPPAQVADEPSADSENVNSAARLVGCGWSAPRTRVVIVDPESRLRLPESVVGEIWVGGDSVAAGYYKKPAETKETFEARIADTGEGPFLRTGDLGFVRGRQLVVTGRIKDLIIVRGRNHYPQDLEATAERSSPMLAKGGGAAVAWEDGSQPIIAIVHELTREGWRRADAAELTSDIREAIAAEHGLQVSRVLLIRPGGLPRTTSRKVRRSICRTMVRAGSFETLHPLSRQPAHAEAHSLAEAT
jgi:acyl-CoA synthetase (AMP-forming)/AMP-acid ligase II